VGTTSGAGEYSPYFFLSYARTPHNDQGKNLNIWVERFYHDLCDEILQQTRLPHGVAPGFMDVDIRTGVEWDRRLARELASCRVFVPLYSRWYFRSVQCGKEWAAFELRRQRYMERHSPPEVIVPARWLPVPQDALPDSITSIQFTHADLRAQYLAQGLYGLMKLRQYRDHYLRAVQALAVRIIEVAEGIRLPAGEPCDYGAIRSAFTGDPERRFQITVVAATRDTLPARHAERRPRPGLAGRVQVDAPAGDPGTGQLLPAQCAGIPAAGARHRHPQTTAVVSKDDSP
jgi:hypothetical protein